MTSICKNQDQKRKKSSLHLIHIIKIKNNNKNNLNLHIKERKKWIIVPKVKNSIKTKNLKMRTEMTLIKMSVQMKKILILENKHCWNIKNKWVPLWVRKSDAPSSGNEQIVQKGANWESSNPEDINFQKLFDNF